MPVILDGKTYYEGIDLTAEAFYKHLEQGGQVSTSQPAPGDVLSLWEGLLADYDEMMASIKRFSNSGHLHIGSVDHMGRVGLTTPISTFL